MKLEEWNNRGEHSPTRIADSTYPRRNNPSAPCLSDALMLYAYWRFVVSIGGRGARRVQARI